MIILIASTCTKLIRLKTLRWPINLATRKTLACIASGFLVRVTAAQKLNQVETERGRGKGTRLTAISPCPPPPTPQRFLSSVQLLRG